MILKKGSSMEMGTYPNRKRSKLKDALITEPVLQYPDFTKPLYLQLSRVCGGGNIQPRKNRPR